ncbi:cyclase family protein [Pseudonocardia ailaonensis]|uniref:Cyclase family protein n=1 Tax=Pseudonocardia ailaonensis TaxID=367279 RepID=A0ABN2MZV1_9PSEU
MTTAAPLATLTALAVDARVFDLGHVLEPEVPRGVAHVPFLYQQTKRHGDVVYDDGLSASCDMFVTGVHVGTHIDGLAHISQDGLLHGGVEPSPGPEHGSGLGIENVAPIVKRAVVLDLPALLGVDVLEQGHRVSAAEVEAALHRQDVGIVPGTAVFFRTGWARDWPALPDVHEAPGPGTEAVGWALDHGGDLFGSDTLAFEFTPGPGLPVHRQLLVERGIHIMEAVALDELCAAGVSEFLLVVAPLRLRGATGSPVRPLALVPGPA